MEEDVTEQPLADACKALGLKECDLLASRIYEDGRVVIVTTDGRKLTWRNADTADAAEQAEKAAPQKGKKPR